MKKERFTFKVNGRIFLAIKKQIVEKDKRSFTEFEILTLGNQKLSCEIIDSRYNKRVQTMRLFEKATFNPTGRVLQFAEIDCRFLIPSNMKETPKRSLMRNRLEIFYC